MREDGLNWRLDLDSQQSQGASLYCSQVVLLRLWASHFSSDSQWLSSDFPLTPDPSFLLFLGSPTCIIMMRSKEQPLSHVVTVSASHFDSSFCPMHAWQRELPKIPPVYIIPSSETRSGSPAGKPLQFTIQKLYRASRAAPFLKNFSCSTFTSAKRYHRSSRKHTVRIPSFITFPLYPFSRTSSRCPLLIQSWFSQAFPDFSGPQGLPRSASLNSWNTGVHHNFNVYNTMVLSLRVTPRLPPDPPQP